MAFLHCFRYWCFLLGLVCFSNISHCMSDQVSIAGRALTCFDSSHVYRSCEESYRLKAEGSIRVGIEATDEYCGGPCVAETKLLLSCVDEMRKNFRFRNGASVGDVRHALTRGCSHSTARGDFTVKRYNDYGDEDNDEYDDHDDCFDHANKLAIPIHLLVFLSCVLLLWGY
ncbi:uncharacterized protein [Typha angustifolia]|uniref:uncharacterized protein n=1 Tax=Typha angustifolia TaxID=59011 RepID=UPI003C2E78E0